MPEDLMSKTLATLDEANEIIVAAVKIIIGLLKELEAAQNKSRWVNAKERQPNHGGKFLCRYAIEVSGKIRYVVEFGVFHLDTGWNSRAITHWMELPGDPPEEDEP